MTNFPGVAAWPGAGRPYERNICPHITPLNRSDNASCELSFESFWKIHKNPY